MPACGVWRRKHEGLARAGQNGKDSRHGGTNWSRSAENSLQIVFGGAMGTFLRLGGTGFVFCKGAKLPGSDSLTALLWATTAATAAERKKLRVFGSAQGVVLA